MIIQVKRLWIKIYKKLKWTKMDKIVLEGGQTIASPTHWNTVQSSSQWWERLLRKEDYSHSPHHNRGLKCSSLASQMHQHKWHFDQWLQRIRGQWLWRWWCWPRLELNHVWYSILLLESTPRMWWAAYMPTYTDFEGTIKRLQ